MPKPHEGESKSEFISRCVEYPDLQSKDKDQRLAICYGIWKEHGGEDKTEQMTPDIEVRHEQTVLAQPQIDREAGILHRVHILGRTSAHGYEYSIPAQRAVRGRWSGMCIAVDHRYDGSPIKLEQTWGEVVEPVEVDDNGTWGSVKYLKAHPLTERILESAERGMPKIGMSAVTRVRKEQNKVVEDFIPVQLDIVTNPATVKNLFEQQTMTIETPDADEAAKKAAKKARKQARREQFTALVTDVAALKQKLYHEQFIAPEQTLQETISKVESTFDSKAFWRD